MSADRSQIKELRKCKALLLAITEYVQFLNAPKIPPNTNWICQPKKAYVCSRSGKEIPLASDKIACYICGLIYAICDEHKIGYLHGNHYTYCRVCALGIMICCDCIDNSNEDLISALECAYCGDPFCSSHLNEYQCQKCSSLIRVCTPDINFRPSLCAVCSNNSQLQN